MMLKGICFMPFFAQCVLLLVTIAMPLVAEQNVNPGINSYYQDPDVTQWRGVFEREGREIWDRRLDILESLKLRYGQSVADIGAGTGFFSLLMAEEVGASGQVYAVDIAENFVNATLQRAKEQGLDNVVGVVNDQYGIKLAPASIDLAFISDTYHHFEYPNSMLKSIHSALKPEGELVIIDFKRIPESSSSWVLGHVRLGEQQVIAEVEASGFQLMEQQNYMQTQYHLRFRKKGTEGIK